MRTNIVIDDQLMSAAMKAGDFKTKKDAVEEGLRLLARRKAYQDLRAARGALQWSVDGDWTSPAAAKPAYLLEEQHGEYNAARNQKSPTKPTPTRKARSPRAR
jgi:antitoxin ParD1/3/4